MNSGTLLSRRFLREGLKRRSVFGRQWRYDLDGYHRSHLIAEGGGRGLD